ncbi:hypothetical protein [Actinomadura sp. DC4]|uniref:hypothetical protein n=1 Tax=Actinomadura sp. DC4 TaxID=3055069 RepID=UPI0025B14E9B|nr:hypothetical protein [Actinomadura sp. DC4]MDN3353160.1 hypothetical protein [Actinomadura sp. DC4]
MKRSDSFRNHLKLAVVTSFSAAALLLVPTDLAQAAPGDNPGKLTALTSSAEYTKLALQEHRVPASSLDNLASAMGTARGVDQVLASANHPMRNAANCSGMEKSALPLKPAAESSYCWDSGDDKTQDWLPQGLTSSGDADDDGVWGTNKVILSGWGENGATTIDHMARIAFIDANDPSGLKYRWVLPVVPLSGGTDYRALKSHIGGMVWYQDKLLVTSWEGDADHNQLYIFDMHRILQATVNSSTVGKVSNGWSADGYQYVMPAIGSYSLVGGACVATNDDSFPCFGSISLDRSSVPASLVATEWFSSGGSRPARVWRYDFDGNDPGYLAKDGNGRVGADQIYETKAVGLQGVLSHSATQGGTPNLYVDDARGGVDQHGILWRQNATGASAAANCGGDITYACWGMHTEGMSYWWNTGRLWTQTEWAADINAKWSGTENARPQRLLYAVPLSSVDGTLN